MNSEKVKKIKKVLEQNTKTCLLYDFEKNTECKVFQCKYILDYINELESENKRLDKSDTSKEESSIEYYNLYKDLKRKNKDLNELCELQRVSIAESFVRENQLKDRIAELQKENKDYYDRLNNLQTYIDNHEEIWKVNTKTQLKQFAERLKEKMPVHYPTVVRAIDETLKEFINE